MATKVINLESLTAVRARFEALKTFDDVAAFDAWAEQQLATIESDLGEAQEQQEIARQATDVERSRIAALNWFRRLFASKAQLANLEAATMKAARVLEVLAEHQDALAEMIEFSPNTFAEQKALLKQMRLEKKELQADKK